MFPTAGLFRGVLCPENDVNKGRCKRPYCHFRHIRRVPSEEQVTEPKYPGDQKAAKTRPAIETSSLPSHRKRKDRTPVAKPIQYVPTPLFLCKKPAKDAFAEAEETTKEEEECSTSKGDGPGSEKGSSQSSYTPTPLAELEAMAEDHDDMALGGESLVNADAVDYRNVQSAKTECNDNQEMGPLSIDEIEKHPSTEQPSMPEGEGDDIVIETHSYGGVTVTTRTPRNLCRSDQTASEEDDEYNPFCSVLEPSEKSRSLKKDIVKIDQSRNGASLHQSFPTDASEGHQPVTDFEPLSKGNVYPAYGTSIDSLDNSEGKNKAFKGYSNTASYSYSDASSAGPMTDLEYNPSYSYATLETDLIDALPAYSTSNSVLEEDNFDEDLHGGYDLDNLEQYHEEDTTKGELKRKVEKKVKVDKQMSRDRGHEKGKPTKTKLNLEKKVMPSTKKEATAASNKASNPSKEKSATVSGKATKVPTKSKPHGEANNLNKMVSNNKKLSRSKSDVDLPQKGDYAKIESMTDKEGKNITSTKGQTIGPVNSGKDKVSDKSKPKVSAEQLAKFFKNRQESSGLKSKGKKKVHVEQLKGTIQAKTMKTEDRNSVKDGAKGNDQNIGNQRKDSHLKEKLSTVIAKEGKQGAPKTSSGDRSLFQSLGKPPAKVLPKKLSVKECNVDLFAIANDSSSDDDDDDDDRRSKTLSKSKSSSAPPRKRSASSEKNRQRNESGNNAKKKKTFSPSKTNDPKRLRKLSSSSLKKESTKIIELDLFGDDSDGDSDEINFISDNEHPIKIPKKSTDSLTSKSKGYSPKSDRHRKEDRSNSAGVSGTSSAGNFLPNSKVTSSNRKSSKVGLSKKPVHASAHSLSANGQGQKQLSKGTLSRKKDPIEEQVRDRKSHSMRDVTHENKKHQQVKNLSRKRAETVSSSEDDGDSSDLPNGLASSDDNDDDDGHNMGGGDNDADYHGDEGEDQGESAYMTEMRRFMEDSSSEDDISGECYQIFQEEQAKASRLGSQTQRKRPEEQRKDAKSGSASVGKQRVAHASKFGDMKRKTTPKKPAISRPGAAQMCHNRYLVMEQRIERASQEGESSSAGVTGKKRVAHQSATTNNTLRQMTLGASSSEKTTTVMTSKMGKRVAHMPKTVAKRPMIPTDYGSKVPMNVRQRYLNVFIDELLKTSEEDQDAFNKALEEERIVYQRASSKNIYLNLCVNALKKLKNQTDSLLQSPPSTPTSPFPSMVISHEAVLGGKLAAQTSYSIHKHSSVDSESFEGIHLYEKLQRYILTETQLRENGYPRPSEISGQAAIYKEEENKKVISSDPNQQVCCRCGTTFLRKPDGKYITRESCTYHWGRPWTRRIAGIIESRFSCCTGDMATKGCCISKLHVTQDKHGNLSGYMKTMPKDIPRNGHPGMYALDCEMCYTSMGLELTRVTVVNDQLKEIYDTLVQPDNDVVDYNTRFSGITENDLKHITTKLRDVQAVLLNMFSAQTILIGHSLESDLLALRMMHSTVIDTAIVFPHRRGPPLKRALKTLMAEYLKRLIQDDVGGHDSAEDARSCMELMIYKVKEDAKIKRKR